MAARMSLKMGQSLSQWQGLEPEGLGHDLLCEWAPWMRDDHEGPSWGQSVGPRAVKGYHGDPPERVRFVDKIVARMRGEQPPYYRVVKKYYLGDKLFWQIAREEGTTEGWCRTMLIAACGLVEMKWKTVAAHIVIR